MELYQTHEGQGRYSSEGLSWLISTYTHTPASNASKQTLSGYQNRRLAISAAATLTA